MNVSPASVSIPTVAPSVNPPTEQVARDNRVREKILPTKPLNESAPEKPVTEDEKQLQNPSWDPAEHPTYDDLPRRRYGYSTDAIDRLKNLLAPGSYNMPDNKGYTMRIKLPPEVEDQLEQNRDLEKARSVVAMRYQQSSVANMPSEVLIVI